MEDRILDNDIDLKKYFLIIVGFIVFIILLIFIFTNESRNGYLIIDESTIVTKDLFGYKQINSFDKDVLKSKYTILGDFGSIKDVTVNRSSSGEWTYFDDGYKDLGVINVKVAHSNKFKNVKVADYEFEYYDSSDRDIIKKVIGDRIINDFTKQVRKSIFDFDGDGKKETIYTLGSSKGKNIFSAIFMVNNDKIINIEEGKNDYLVREIVDIDGDGKYELIVSKGAWDVMTPESLLQIYKVNKNSVKCIMNCK